MKFAVFSLMQWPEDRDQGDVFRNELDQMALAEEQGYDAAWLGEHHFGGDGIGPSIHLTAAQLAARTERMRIGTAVTILPFWHPLRVAEEIAVLDILSNGRIDWVVGCSDPAHELDEFGEDIAKSHRVFREQLDVVKRAWTGERFAHDGEFFQFPELQCLPTPVQQPHPPMWVAALSPTTFEWAAEHHYPVLTDPFSPLTRIEENRRLYLEKAAAAGFDPAGVALPVLRQVYVGETMAKAREQAAPALRGYDRAVSRAGPPGGPSGESGAVVGDEAYCRDKLSELCERIGLDYLLTWQNFGSLPHEATLASQRRFIEKVAPAFA